MTWEQTSPCAILTLPLVYQRSIWENTTSCFLHSSIYYQYDQTTMRAHLVLNIRFKTRDGETSTLNSRFRLIQLNFWHQLYYTPSRLHTFKISISPLRFRCAVEEGTSLHSAWLWPKVKVLWVQVCTIISQIHGLIFHWIQRYVYWAITQILTSSIIKLTQMLLTIAENALL